MSSNHYSQKDSIKLMHQALHHVIYIEQYKNPQGYFGCSYH